MIEELSYHILDVVVNSITAGSRNISVIIDEDREKSILTIEISDDGKGMDTDMVAKVQDPFFSTKTGRKVGLGIPLLKGTAEETGGTFTMESAPGEGSRIKATFDTSHPDLPVMGNLQDTIFILVVGNPDVNFLFRYIAPGRDFVLDTKEIKAALGEVAINSPEAVGWLQKYLQSSL